MLDKKLERSNHNAISQTASVNSSGGNARLVQKLDYKPIPEKDYLVPDKYLNILEQIIQEKKDISDADKRSLTSKIKELRNNQWIAGIGSAAIVEVAKKLLSQ
jgi:hypothetical protein